MSVARVSCRHCVSIFSSVAFQLPPNDAVYEVNVQRAQGASLLVEVPERMSESIFVDSNVQSFGQRI